MHKQFLDFLAEFSRKNPQFESLVDSVGKAYSVILEAGFGYTDMPQGSMDGVTNEQIDRFRSLNPDWRRRSDNEVRSEILRRRKKHGSDSAVRHMASIWDTSASPKKAAADIKKRNDALTGTVRQTTFEKNKHDAIIDGYNKYVEKTNGKPKYTLEEYARNRIDFLNASNAERIAREGSGSFRMIDFYNVFPEFRKEAKQLHGDTDLGKFRPGNRVKAVSGEFAGMHGEVVSCTQFEAKVKFSMFNGTEMEGVVPVSDLELVMSAEPAVVEEASPFNAGDTVEILSGEYRGMKGSVVSGDAKQVTVAIRLWGTASVKETFPVSQVVKSDDSLPSDAPKSEQFSAGEPVTIDDGEYAGMSGTVVTVDGPIVTVSVKMMGKPFNVRVRKGAIKKETVGA